mmetsp:Transcript_70305/g.123944  ORF Transcript_70305/g.123944 Transcript_70305/m.123944 type:complete len:87 (-) Transcript_70305:1391-1651(-)
MGWEWQPVATPHANLYTTVQFWITSLDQTSMGERGTHSITVASVSWERLPTNASIPFCLHMLTIHTLTHYTHTNVIVSSIIIPSPF